LKQVIAVTGASGFIGRSICTQLLARDYAVRALIRNSRKAPLHASADYESVPGDLADRGSLERLIRGADAVIHCAGVVRGGAQSRFDRVNVEGTRNLLLAMAEHEVPLRLLYLSSLAAREPQLSFYAGSKRRAEQLLTNGSVGLAWTILRPPAVYGPGDRELLPLFRLMAHGIAPTAGRPTARFSMLHVKDLSSAVIAWLRTEPTPEGIYALDDGHAGGYDWHEIGAVVGEICHRKVRVMRTAAWLLDAVAWANARIGPVLGTAPMLTPQKLRELRHADWVCSNAEFRQVVRWQPRIGLAEGLRTMPGWPGYRA